jgi:hypothetical protein
MAEAVGARVTVGGTEAKGVGEAVGVWVGGRARVGDAVEVALAVGGDVAGAG